MGESLTNFPRMAQKLKPMEMLNYSLLLEKIREELTKNDPNYATMKKLVLQTKCRYLIKMYLKNYDQFVLMVS